MKPYVARETAPKSTLICLELIDSDRLAELETIVGSKFKRRALLAQAVTHRSCHHDVNGKVIIQSNEKLEHLGDSVVRLAVCAFLHKKYPEEAEHFYSQVLATAVSNATLSDVGESLDLVRFLITRENCLLSKTVGADLVEAITAALHLDQGSSAVNRFLSFSLYPRVRGIALQVKQRR